jgi:hypothetical protein
MRTKNMNLEAFEIFTERLAYGFASTVLLMLLLLALLLAAGLVGSSFAQSAQPKSFASPQEASDALFQAVQNQDEPALEAILGAGREVTSSSDEVEDKLEHEQFSQKYQEMHRLVREADGTTVLYIGAENWPFPVPLVLKNGAWYFDSDRGEQEILFRRIGENEATAIEVCQEFAIAKNDEVAKAASEDPITQFAESLVSAASGNADDKGANVFHGYNFRVVTDSDGKKKGGLTLVAYPADYKSSGVMTFVVTQHGIVYQNDLGPTTTKVAKQIKARSGPDWRPAA